MDEFIEVIAQSTAAARKYSRGSRITIADLSRTIKRFTKSSAEQWRQSLLQSFTSDKGVNHELKELQRSIKKFRTPLTEEVNTNTFKSTQGEQRQMTQQLAQEQEVANMSTN